ncbi:MAG: hypothetical protein GY810_25285 [Aureispira sp.]|nr:hypothetical protein [Aureispira sp.]
MSFLNDLKTGNNQTLKISLPKSLQLEDEFPLGARLNDRKTGLSWHVGRSMGMLDLSPENRESIFENLELIAASDFDAYFETLDENKEKTSRTKSEQWSPIIQKEVIDVDGHKILSIIRRLSYQPGSEVVIGDLLIPTSDTTYMFTVHAGTNTTGYRESVLMSKLLASEPELNLDDKELFAKNNSDDEKYDDEFAEHPLSLVRNALKRILYHSKLKVLSPYQPTTGEVILPNVGCAIQPPQQFVHAPIYTMMMSPTLAMFTQKLIEPFVSTISLCGLNVWQLTDERINATEPSSQLDELEALAIETLNKWEDEGAENIRVQTKKYALTNNERKVESYVVFDVQNRTSHALAIWLLDEQMRIFRIDVSASTKVPVEKMRGFLQVMMNSFRVLRPDEIPQEKAKPQPQSPTKKWWQFWK